MSRTRREVRGNAGDLSDTDDNDFDLISRKRPRNTPSNGSSGASDLLSKWGKNRNDQPIKKKSKPTDQPIRKKNKPTEPTVPKKSKLSSDASSLVHNLTAASTTSSSISSKQQRTSTVATTSSRVSNNSHSSRTGARRTTDPPRRQSPVPPLHTQQQMPRSQQHPHNQQLPPHSHQLQPPRTSITKTEPSLTPQHRQIMGQLDAFSKEAGSAITLLRPPSAGLDTYGSWLDDTRDKLDFFDKNDQGQIVLYPQRPMFPEEFPAGYPEHPLAWWGIVDPIRGQRGASVQAPVQDNSHRPPGQDQGRDDRRRPGYHE